MCTPYEMKEAISFVYKISHKLIENYYRIVNTFGLEIENSVINGALSNDINIYNNLIILIFSVCFSNYYLPN
ncbi:hypothetical protein [Xenorhabdus bovienii]|uniref:NAD(+) hydrolase ThsA Sir2/TIR-associating SLOG domain-containing protein n=2 Tax=Xenorhabdus bovienii TaxID=40576 RepID=A0A077N836_XENBV|nr:hypothetical protein XBP1_3010035 [Xenorhabdus bovienii str. puntauvense]CDH00699.1 hypothetical protein XBFM1_1740062 [Xenorhabdus bovienii str. feltiae Moldova]